MSERDILLRWLAGAAARLCIARRLRDAGLLGCTLFGLLALHQIMRALVPVPPVVAVLTPLFMLAALACAGWFAWRLSRGVTLAEAAGAADRRAGLKDELKSAYWLGERIEAKRRAALVPLLMQRAAGDAQRLDPRRLFPLRFPSSVAAALGLALLAAVLGWLSPRIAYPTADAGASGEAPASGRARADPGAQTGPEAHLDAGSLPVAERDRAAWSALDQLAADLHGGPEAEDLKRALAARDAGRAALILAAMQRREAAAALLPGHAARPEGEQMSAQFAQGILERLQSLMQTTGDSTLEVRTDRPAPPQHTAHLTEQLREEVDQAQRDKGGRHSEGETHLNDMLRAISRSSIGERQVLQGDGDLAEDHGRTSLGGGAMGRRVGVSRAGGDGERPQGDPDGDAESEAVLGARTERLQTQLRKVRAEGGDDAQSDQGSEENFYAATRAQAAQLDYRAIQARRAAASESVVAAEQAPLAFRQAVKRYSLMQHRRER